MKCEEDLQRWLDGRPDTIRELTNKIKPWVRYRLKPTGQHCDLESYYEDGTVSVLINGHDSKFLNMIYIINEISVFGVNPSDLEPII